ncbi:hypothetical protein WJX84_006733 [Apatococcus fuscideae]|uniref:LisH domain-containing protein n=1 Tax=Apatococcus fuscideae TaxID=2026836 RepID=A0AAW1SXW2_9CHLO
MSPYGSGLALDGLIQRYLQERGYDRSGEALSCESSNAGPAPTVLQAGRFREVLQDFFNAASSQYAESFDSFAEWADSSLDLLKEDLQKLLYPVFVHCYLRLVTEDQSIRPPPGELDARALPGRARNVQRGESRQDLLQGFERSGSAPIKTETVERAEGVLARQKSSPFKMLRSRSGTPGSFPDGRAQEAHLQLGQKDGEDLLGKDIEDVAPGPDVEAQRGPARRFTPRGCFCSVRDSLAGRIRDFKGAGKQRPQRAELLQVILTFAGTLLSLMLTAGISIWMTPGLSLPILLAPLGATAATLFGLLDAPAAQPRSVFYEMASYQFVNIYDPPGWCAVGTLLSCVVGSILRVPLGHVLYVCGPLAVAITLAVMQLTGTVHPPGCGITLIVSLLSPSKPCSIYKDGTAEPWWRTVNAWELRRTLEGSLGARIVQGFQLSTGAVIGTCVILLSAIIVRWCLPRGKKYPPYPSYW